MRKLELKELKGYLGTGVKVQWIRSDDKEVIQSELTISDYDFLIRRNEAKPILHPLSDLTKYCDDLVFVPIDWFEKNMDNSKYKPSAIMSDGSIEIGFLNEFEKLYDWHFDIHGLIQDNLAIDINTIK